MSASVKILYLLVLVAAMASCRSTKTIKTVISRKDSVGRLDNDSASRVDSLKFMDRMYEGIESNEAEFETFSAKVKVIFQGSNGKRNDFNASIRLYKDSVLWISVNALLGFEAFRVLITPDSVKVLDKIDKVAQLRSVNYLNEITKLPFSFRELQDLVIGRPIYFRRDDIVSYRQEGEQVVLLSQNELFRHLLTLNGEGYQLLHSRLDDVDPIRARSAFIVYGDYENKSGKPFSTFRKITASDKSKLDIEMKYRQYEFNGALNFPFSVPKNYKLQ